MGRATSTYSYENLRRVSYTHSEHGDAQFVPVCAKCFRFVKADATIRVGAITILHEPNATCSKCGRTEMLFEGWM